MARDQLDLVEGQHAAIDKGADIARQSEMHPGQGRHCAGTAEHLDLAGADLAADAVLALEGLKCGLGLGDHGAVDRRRHLDAAKPLGEGDDAERQGDRAEDLRHTVAGAMPAQPHDLGRAAADIEDERVRNARMQQRRAAGDDEPGLLGGGDDLELDADLVAHAVEKLGAILGAAAGFGCDITAGHDLALAELAGADPQGLDRPRHRRLGEPAGGREALTQTHDA